MSFQEILTAARQGNQGAFGELYNMTYNRNYYVVMKMVKNEADTMDVLQDTYIKVYTKLMQFAGSDEKSFSAWTGKIASCTALDYLKKKNPVLFSQMILDNGETMEIEIEDTNMANQPDIAFDQKETAAIVQELLNTLPDEQRACVIMHYINQISIKEIAQELGCSENTVKSRLGYAKKKIQSQEESLKSRGVKLYGMSAFALVTAFLVKEAGLFGVSSAGGAGSMGAGIAAINAAAAKDQVLKGAISGIYKMYSGNAAAGNAVMGAGNAAMYGGAKAGAYAGQMASQMAVNNSAGAGANFAAQAGGMAGQVAGNMAGSVAGSAAGGISAGGASGGAVAGSVAGKTVSTGVAKVGLSLAAKIGIGVASAAIVVTGTVGTIVVTKKNKDKKAEKTTEIVTEVDTNEDESTEIVIQETTEVTTEATTEVTTEEEIVYPDDLVFDDSDFSTTIGSYIYTVPYIDYKGEAVAKVNKEIQEDATSLIEPSLKEYNDSSTGGYVYTCGGISYEWWMNGDVLTLIVHRYLWPDASGWDDFLVYNINLKEDKLLDKAGICEYFGITEDEYFNQVQDALSGYCASFLSDLVTNYPNQREFAQDRFDKTSSKENVNAAEPYIGEDGTLWVDAYVYSMAGGDKYPGLISVEENRGKDYGIFK